MSLGFYRDEFWGDHSRDPGAFAGGPGAHISYLEARTQAVSVADAAPFLRLGSAAQLPATETQIIQQLIEQAEDFAVRHTGHELIHRSMEARYDSFSNAGDGQGQGLWLDSPSVLPWETLPYGPAASSVPVEVYTEDSDGVETQLAPDEFQVATSHLRTRVQVHLPYSHDIQHHRLESLIFRYTGGLSPDAQGVPAAIRTAVMQMVGYLYDNRYCSAEDAARSSGALSSLSHYRSMFLL